MTKRQKEVKCRLCHRDDHKLCDSHIVPEFLYRNLYNSKDQIMGITGRGNKGYKLIQKGSYEKLLCSCCEKYLNDKYENPFMKQWTIDSPLPKRMTKDSLYSAVYDYPTFKLFHLSILFRESVSSLPTFEAVKLGVNHEERIRQMLLATDPGYDWEYPIFAYIVLNGRGEIERRLITRPDRVRFNDGHIVYKQIYGGAMWCISVSSHRNKWFCQDGLQPNGSIKMIAVSWNEIVLVQAASKALKRISP